MEIKADFDYSVLKKMEEAEQRYGSKCVERAQRDALKKGKTALSKEVRDRYNMKKRDFESYVNVGIRGLIVESEGLTPGNDTHFSITPKTYSSQEGIPVKRRRKATVTIKKGNKKRMQHAFIMNPDKIGHSILFEHGNSNRGKDTVKSVKSVSAAQMASNEEIANKTMEVMNKELETRLQHYVGMEADKIANN